MDVVAVPSGVWLVDVGFTPLDVYLDWSDDLQMGLDWLDWEKTS